LRTLLLICCAAVQGSAAPVTWSLNGILDDGGTAIGSFVYDAGTNTYSAVNISTTSGSFPGATYGFVCVAPCVFQTPLSVGFSVLTQSSASDLTGTPALLLLWNAPLTDAGGTIKVNGQFGGNCFDAVCSGVQGRTIIGGSVASEVPEPSTVLLTSVTGAILGGLHLQRRRNRTPLL
jgi:hypothetical protein